MRLWSIHPKLLDRMGLLGLWREALLAQRIIYGGPPYKVPYGNHPQLERFKLHPDPKRAIARYLDTVYWVGKNRGYKFNVELIEPNNMADRITVSRGQINYEIRLLLKKLEKRDKQKRTEVINSLLIKGKIERPPLSYDYAEVSSFFKIDNKDMTIASWERPIKGV